MFLSKIWFFLIAVAGATALTIALLLPRPSDRQREAEERQRVVTSCDVVNILLTTNARGRVDLASKFARSDVDLAGILGPVSTKSEVSSEVYKNARTAATKLMDSTTGAKPSFIILVDNRGRVAARLGIRDKQYGDVLAGYFLVDDALDGYMRDDLWIIEKQLYLVAASPVVGNGYAGAVIVGHLMDKDFASKFVDQLGVNVNFYAQGELMASSSTASVHKEISAQYARISASETPIESDCREFDPFLVDLGDKAYTAALARLPGEAGGRGAFFSVFVEHPTGVGVMGTLSSVQKQDRSFSNFPWITLGLGLIFVLGVGMGLMIWEADRPIKRLSKAAVQLAKGEIERFDEGAHRGKFGSIARSLNIRLDKAEREAKAKKTDLDDLLGGSSSALPLAGPGTPSLPVKPPPPSEFKFTGNKPRAATPPPVGPPRAATAPPKPPRAATAPPALPRAATAPPVVPAQDSEPVELGGSQVTELPNEPADNPEDDALFRRVFQKYLKVKKECGESISNLTYDKFATKLRNNRKALQDKHGCKEVKFEVYVKDGKAALKASPVKEG